MRMRAWDVDWCAPRVGLSRNEQMDRGALAAHLCGLLDTSGRAGVWPDSVQVLGGTLSIGLPTGLAGVAHFRTAARRVP